MEENTIMKDQQLLNLADRMYHSINEMYQDWKKKEFILPELAQHDLLQARADAARYTIARLHSVDINEILIGLQHISDENNSKMGSPSRGLLMENTIKLIKELHEPAE